MRLAGILLLAMLATPARAEQLSVDVLAFGEMLGTPVDTERDPALRSDTLAGVQTLAHPRFATEGSQVVGRYCRGIGLMFQLRGLPAGEYVVLQVHNTHPVLVRPDGVSSQEDVYEIRVDATPSWVGFTFAESWSLIAGRWAFSLHYRDRLLATQAFDVQRAPDPGTLDDQGCSPATS